jgi:AcrR family transcriptional regulator
MPNRAAELRWEDDATGAAPRGLSRAAIVEAAIAVADREGIAAVSIRRVASELDARPMSLYTHIASKEDLVDLMLNEVIAEVLVPEPLPQDWRAALAAVAHASYAAFRRHLWVLKAIGTSTRMGPSTLRHADQSLAALSSLDLDVTTKWTVLGIVDDYTLGHVIRAAAKERISRRQVGEIDPARFPHLAAADPGGTMIPRASSFAVGLDVVLDGIQARFLS